MIFNIQKCSIHDGSGLRTLVFFKGCPLRCKWCANPESQSYEKEIMESPSKCIGCGACMEVCPVSAIKMTEEEGPKIDRTMCRKCFKCTDRCYAGAKYPVGEEYEINEIYRHIDRDRIFYSIKGGGVTFSGGEPLTQPDYLTKIAKKCVESGIDTAIESCGMGTYNKFKTALPYITHVFFDIKHIDSAVHEELTGSGNELILKNLKLIAQHVDYITVRTPVIPGLNDSVENIRGIAEFIKDIPSIKEYELLPYHQFGVNKYKALGKPYELEDVEPPSDDEIRNLTGNANDVLEGSGKECFYTKDNARIVVRLERH